MPHLGYLGLSRTGVGDGTLAAVEGISTVSTLNLASTAISDAGLQHIEGLTNLGQLDFSGTQISDAGLAHLWNLKNLTSLGLRGTRVTGTGLKYLKRLPGEGNTLVRLDLASSAVTDSGLVGLDGMWGLGLLDLSDTAIGDAGLVHLRCLDQQSFVNLADPGHRRRDRGTGTKPRHRSSESRRHPRHRRRARAPREDALDPPEAPKVRPVLMLPTKTDQRTILWVTPLLALLTAALYWPACRNGFVGYDDGDYVCNNEHVLSGLSGGLVWALSTYDTANWHPLTWLSLQLDAELYGRGAAGFHRTNVILHAASTALLFLAFHAMTGALWRSVVVAVLFAVHPLHVESVAWVSERKERAQWLFLHAHAGGLRSVCGFTERSDVCAGGSRRGAWPDGEIDADDPTHGAPALGLLALGALTTRLFRFWVRY